MPHFRVTFTQHVITETVIEAAEKATALIKQGIARVCEVKTDDNLSTVVEVRPGNLASRRIGRSIVGAIYANDPEDIPNPLAIMAALRGNDR